jgi:ribulose-5-phosphate 4-epimerase/fuculose-1-phosphate aldolase
MGWTELIYTHITLRLAGPEGHFLINPFGLNFDEVTASNLVKIDGEGRAVDPAAWPVNPAGFTIHAAIHSGIGDAHCVMHTHTTAGMAVACSEGGLSQSNFYSAQLYGKVGYHDFEGVTLHSEEGPRLVRSIGGKPAVILRNHGLLAWGDSIERAFAVLWLLNRACEIQLATLSMGPAIPVPEAISIQSTRESLLYDKRYGAGKDVFAALTRKIDRLDSSYKD